MSPPAGQMRSLSAIKLSHADFRFLHAWVEGVDVQAAWALFMMHRGAGDPRHIRSTVRVLLDMLATTAKRTGDATTAALLRRDPLRIKAAAIGEPPPSSRASGAPTLETFRAQLAEPDFFSESELVVLWEEKFGKAAPRSAHDGRPAARPRDTPQNRSMKRRARLVRRQREALQLLESLVAVAPVPADPLAAWLDDATCRRLGLVGLNRLGDLVGYLNRHGYRWYRKVPRIGLTGAQRLAAWLNQHADSLGKLAPYALRPLEELSTHQLAPEHSQGIAPIERLVIPPELAGDLGTNRKPLARCKIRAVNDYQAVRAWLDRYQPTVTDGKASGNHNTWVAYRKESERFLLWAVFERGRAFSSLDSIDCTAYLRFLEAPGAPWVGPRGSKRWSPEWRPFEGPLDARSLQMAETVCKGLCKWLVGVNYLDTNPWDGTPRGGKLKPLRQLRALNDRQFAILNDWLVGLPSTPANSRLQLLFHLALTTGMRKDELARARVSWLRMATDESGDQEWTLQFYGKGGKERAVPLLPDTADMLFDHLANKGLSVDFLDDGVSLDAVPGETPLLSRLDDATVGVPGSRIYSLVKDALAKCAEAVEADHPKVARQLTEASTHWLRHTFGRLWADRGGELRALGELMGHENPATTAIYTRTDEARRRRELQKVFGGANGL